MYLLNVQQSFLILLDVDSSVLPSMSLVDALPEILRIDLALGFSRLAYAGAQGNTIGGQCRVQGGSRMMRHT
jgi:hypothetical protein